MSVPVEFTRAGNVDPSGVHSPVADTCVFAYGTAGFRAKASLLPFALFRMGYLAGIRSRYLNKTMGVMVTASHNAGCDNGVKLIDPMGEMLEARWERAANELVNCSDEGFASKCASLEAEFAPSTGVSLARVACAYDSRESSPYLQTAVERGVALSNSCFHSFGLLTTPQLHYIVRCENDTAFGPAGEDGYYRRFTDSFIEILKVLDHGSVYVPEVRVDCANGVGATQLRKLLGYLPPGLLNVTIVNGDAPQLLNSKCGADFVKISHALPIGFEEVPAGTRCATFDGDADRLMYFFVDPCPHSGIVVLDGDKVAVLIAKFIKEQLVAAGLVDSLTFAIVQTAYANGESTKYIRDKMKVLSKIVPTGVKHLHHEASKYDIGVYFEANGHGTVTFSEKFRELVRQREHADESVAVAVRRLLLISTLINEVVGDAMADFLVVEALLRHYDWSVSDWASNLYKDAANCQLKLEVKDRYIFKTTFDETKCLEPKGFQNAIDDHVSDINKKFMSLMADTQPGRAFVRPSGTENIVRVYAEGSTKDHAAEIGDAVAECVKTWANRG